MKQYKNNLHARHLCSTAMDGLMGNFWRSSCIIILLFCFGVNMWAQAPRSYQWQWAHTGGGNQYLITNEVLGSNRGINHISEQVKDIAIDQHNNLYMGAQIGYQPVFMGDTIASRSTFWITGDGWEYCNANIYIASLGCEGNLRWQYVIGGGATSNSSDYFLTDIEADTLGGVYVSLVLPAWTDTARFGNDTLIVKDEGNLSPSNREITLVKLDTAGNYRWIIQPQNINSKDLERNHNPLGLYVEPNGTIHWFFEITRSDSLVGGQVIISDSLFARKDMMVLKYDRDGNFLGHLFFPVHGLGRKYLKANGGTDGYNEVYFRYEPVTKQYYLHGWLYYQGFYAEAIIANDTIPKINNADYATRNAYSGYIAAFDSLGNHLWHEKTNWFCGHISSADFDNEGNVYINPYTGSFAGVIYDPEMDDPNPLAEPKQYVVKMSPDGQVVNYSLPINMKVYSYKYLKYNNGEIALNGYAHPEQLDYTKTKWLFTRINWSTMQETEKKVYPSIPYFHTANRVKVLTTDLYGNYLLGGAVGSSIQLSPTLSISNSGGMRSQSDFFIAKYGGYSCDEELPGEPSGIAEIEAESREKLLFYPNPATELLHFDSTIQGLNYSLHSIQGALLQSGKTENTVSVRGYNSGMYLLRIENKSYKLMIK